MTGGQSPVWHFDHTVTQLWKIDSMEHRAGIEPANTGFADRPYDLFSVIYTNYTILKGTEKEA
jgi:hypothetical protein